MKKKLKNLSACAAVVLVFASINFSAFAEGGECTGPKKAQDGTSWCTCTNSNQCSDTSGCESGGGGINWGKVLDMLIAIFK